MAGAVKQNLEREIGNIFGNYIENGPGPGHTLIDLNTKLESWGRLDTSRDKKSFLIKAIENQKAAILKDQKEKKMDLEKATLLCNSRAEELIKTVNNITFQNGGGRRTRRRRHRSRRKSLRVNKKSRRR